MNRNKIVYILVILLGITNCVNGEINTTYDEMVTVKKILQNKKEKQFKLLSTKNLDIEDINTYLGILSSYSLFDEQISFVEKLINRCIELYGEDHILTQTGYIILAQTYINTGKKDKGMKIFEQVKDISENKIYEYSKGFKFNLFTAYVDYYLYNKRLKLAQKYAQKSIDLVDCHPKNYSEECVETKIQLIKILNFMHDYNRSRNIGMDTLVNMNKNIKSDSLVKVNLGLAINQAIDNPIISQKLLNNIIKDLKNNNKIYTPISIKVHNDLGAVLYQLKQIDLAITAFKKSLVIADKLGINNAPSRIVSYYGLGSAEIYNKNLDKAEKALQEALGIVKKIVIPEMQNEFKNSILSLMRDVNELKKKRKNIKDKTNK